MTGKLGQSAKKKFKNMKCLNQLECEKMLRSSMLQKFASGEKIQYLPSSSAAWIDIENINIERFLQSPESYQVAPPQPIPNPPIGKEWHNPQNLNYRKVGFDNGWRLMLKGELTQLGRYEFWDGGTFVVGYAARQAIGTVINERVTCRTKEPLPIEKKIVPLKLEDIKPGDIITSPCWSGAWRMVIGADNVKVDTKTSAYSFEYMKDNNFLISRDNGATWTKCEKTV